MKKCIDYSIIANAIQYYNTNGYQYLDSEWLVPRHIANITTPHFCNMDEIYGGILVGSGEQFFLHEVYEQRLKPGKYCCATPCFRDDPEDEFHGRYFFKVELIDTEIGDRRARLDHMLATAKRFFYTHEVNTSTKDIDNVDHFMIDIVDSAFGIELGSYGMRHHQDVGWWVYGTGVAEPRLSLVKGKWNDRL